MCLEIGKQHFLSLIVQKEKDAIVCLHGHDFDPSSWLLLLSRLDYCIFWLADVPQKHPLRKRVMNCAARLVYKLERISPLLADLHLFPVCLRIEYKIATVC